MKRRDLLKGFLALPMIIPMAMKPEIKEGHCSICGDSMVIPEQGNDTKLRIRKATFTGVTVEFPQERLKRHKNGIRKICPDCVLDKLS